MCEWKEYEVKALIKKDLLSIGDGYRAKNSELSDEGIPFARAGNLNGGFDFSNCDYFPREDLKKVGEKKSQVGDVVFTSKGTVGRFAFVDEKTPEFVFSPQLCYWRSLDESIIHARFLYYWMQSRAFIAQIYAVKGQTDMADYVSLRDQRQMNVTLPEIQEQKKIASIFSVLDKKITLLQRQNQTLEKIAQTLFKHWFVDFEFPDEEGKPYRSSGGKMVASEFGEVPVGWKIVCFDSVSSFSTGKGLKRENYTDSGLYPIMGANGELGRTNEYLFDETLILTGRVGTLGIVTISRGRVWVSDNAIIIRPLSRSLFYYSYFILRGINFDALNRGSTQPLITQGDLKIVRVILPNSRLLELFQEIVSSLFEKTFKNENQILALTKTRDTLLPKLMSGQIRISDPEKTGL